MLTLNQGKGQNGGSFATSWQDLWQVVRPDLNVRGIFKGFWTSPGRNEHLEFDLRTLTLVRKVAQVAALGGSSDRNKTFSDPFLDAHSGSGRSKSI